MACEPIDSDALRQHEQLAHSIDQLPADSACRQQKGLLAPGALVAVGMTLGAVIFAAGAGFMKILGWF